MSRSKSKAKPASAKQRVPAQVAHPAPETQPPADKSLHKADAEAQVAKTGKEAELEIPLDLLCDMTWRVGGYDRPHHIDMREWLDHARKAYSLIRAVNTAKEAEELGESQARADEREIAQKWGGKLTLWESYEDHVSFEKGCLLLDRTKDPKGKDAIEKFRRAYDKGLLLSTNSMKKFEEEGFKLDELLTFDRVLSHIPASELRAEYGSKTERSQKKRGG